MPTYNNQIIPAQCAINKHMHNVFWRKAHQHILYTIPTHRVYNTKLQLLRIVRATDKSDEVKRHYIYTYKTT